MMSTWDKPTQKYPTFDERRAELTRTANAQYYDWQADRAMLESDASRRLQEQRQRPALMDDFLGDYNQRLQAAQAQRKAGKDTEAQRADFDRRQAAAVKQSEADRVAKMNAADEESRLRNAIQYDHTGNPQQYNFQGKTYDLNGMTPDGAMKAIRSGMLKPVGGYAAPAPSGRSSGARRQATSMISYF